MRIGLIGATGMVGTEMLSILEERSFPVEELRPYASARSEGRKLRRGGVHRPGPDRCLGAAVVPLVADRRPAPEHPSHPWHRLRVDEERHEERRSADLEGLLDVLPRGGEVAIRRLLR